LGEQQIGGGGIDSIQKTNNERGSIYPVLQPVKRRRKGNVLLRGDSETWTNKDIPSSDEKVYFKGKGKKKADSVAEKSGG